MKLSNVYVNKYIYKYVRFIILILASAVFQNSLTVQTKEESIKVLM